MTIGENLLALRKKKGLSQEEVGDRLHVSRQTISKWETDQSTPDFDKIVPICELFDISADELLKGQEIEKEKIALVENKGRNKKTALVVSVCVAFYIFSLVLCIILDGVNAPDAVIGASFMMIVGITSCVLIYHFMSLPKNEQEERKLQGGKNRQKYAAIDSILFLITIIVYFLISFSFQIWDLSWIIFLIFLLVRKIIHLIMMLGDKNEE